MSPGLWSKKTVSQPQIRHALIVWPGTSNFHLGRHSLLKMGQWKGWGANLSQSLGGSKYSCQRGAGHRCGGSDPPSPSPLEQKDSGVNHRLTSPQAQLPGWCNHNEYPGEGCTWKKNSAVPGKTLPGLWALGEQDSLRQETTTRDYMCFAKVQSVMSKPLLKN